MSVKCQVVMEAMDKLAPRYLAESWDNVGLLLGSPAQTINKVVVALDVTAAVVEEAIKNHVDMIIAHHPLIFKGITAIRTDLPQGQLLAQLLKADIAVYAAHTNLDSATAGVNDILAQKLKIVHTEPLEKSFSEKLLKLVVFVPSDYAEQVRFAITHAGAGHLGNYSHCTFQTLGTGSFLPQEGTKPFVGEAGTLEHVQEVRLETIVSEKISKKVIKAMLKVHPYEEVAYDIYPLHNVGTTLGLGRIGKLKTAVTLDEFVQQVKEALGIKYVTVAGELDKVINKVAVCGGSGASLLHKAAFAGADVLVTGDVKYHEAQAALASGIAVIDAGHFATEQPVVQYVVDYLTQCAVNGKWSIDISQDVLHSDILSVR